MPLYSLYAPLMQIFGSRPWVLCWPRAGSVGNTLRALQDMGAPPPFVIASQAGKPLDPALRIAGSVLIPAVADMPGMYGEFLGWEAAMQAVDPALLHAWDPERRAAVLTPTGTVLRSIAGREVWGGEPLSTRKLIEDKTLVIDIFNQSDVPTGPVRVCRLDAAAQAARDLDQGGGTVWAGDAKDRIDGGGQGTRWVHDAATERAAQTALGRAERRIRVMPYYPGVPCAVQGMCTPDGTAVFEPMEMVVLMEPATGAVHFCGMATLWEPSDRLRAEMRAAARRVGDHLARRFGWRGGFSLDGIASPAVGPDTAGDGAFWPTEINARFSGGLSRLDRIHGGPPLAFAHRALWADEAFELPSALLERTLCRHARARRICGVRYATEEVPSQDHTLSLGPDSTLHWTDGEGYGTLEFKTDPLRRTPGPPVGPEFCAAIDQARDTFGLALPQLHSPAASDRTR